MTDPWGYKPTKKWSDGRTSSTCQDHLNTGRWAGHDWALLCGYPQRAIWHGKVIFAGLDNKTSGAQFGYLVIVQHDNGLQSWYAHLQNNIPVSKGDEVRCGDIIGYTGSTGNSTGCHCHLGIKKKNTYIASGWLCPLPHLHDGIAAGEYVDTPDYKYIDLSLLQQVPILGIDISDNQPNYNFERTLSKCPNFKFAMLRASDGTYTDTSFLRHYAEAKKLGLMVGAYHYLRSSNISGQLTTFVNAVRNVEVDFPMIIDFESGGASSNKDTNRKNVRSFAEGIVANDDKLKYSAAYYVWKQMNFDYMTQHYGPLGWNRENDHGGKNWAMIYTNKPSWNLIGSGTENWELLPLWQAAWGDTSYPTPFGDWSSYATWHCHQMGQGKPSDFGTTVDVDQWKPNLPFPTEDEPPPPVGTIPVHIINDVSFEANVNGIKYRGTLTIDQEIELEQVV